MSQPFGGHPTFGKYLVWAADEHGFSAQTGFVADASGRSHMITRIFKDGGPSVVVPGIKQNEHLAPAQVGYLDRRLDVASPWFSVDDN